jgi:hypothetical protein
VSWEFSRDATLFTELNRCGIFIVQSWTAWSCTLSHMNSRRLRTLIALLLTATAIIFAARRHSLVEAQRHTGTDTYAITNAKIVTVSGATIDRGTVVVRDGLIAAVGANANGAGLTRAPSTEPGLTVYPGVFDANTTLGIPRPSPSPGAAVAAVDSRVCLGRARPLRLHQTQVNCPACSQKFSLLI